MLKQKLRATVQRARVGTQRILTEALRVYHGTAQCFLLCLDRCNPEWIRNPLEAHNSVFLALDPAGKAANSIQNQSKTTPARVVQFLA